MLVYEVSVCLIYISYIGDSYSVGGGSRGGRLVGGQIDLGRGRPTQHLQCRFRSGDALGDWTRIVCTLPILLCYCKPSW
jgi:hypothetical protein